MKILTASILLFIALLSCTAARQPTRFTIGFTTLHNYAINPTVSLVDKINYIFINNETDFLKTFHMTKASYDKAISPDFTRQSVVAVILQPTEKVVDIEINKISIAGEILLIHYNIIDTTAWKTYTQTPYVLAAVSRNFNVKKVNFYHDNALEKTVSISH